LEGLSDSEGDDEDFHDAEEKPILSLDGWDDLPDLDLSTQYLLYRESSIVAPGVLGEDERGKREGESMRGRGGEKKAKLLIIIQRRKIAEL
jgi:hypothetical protein